MSSRDLVIAGGGAIGLSVAFAAAREGMAVTVIDASPGKGAVWAAAGMLAPISEAHFGEEPLVALLLAAATRWPSFATELEAAADLPVALQADGTIQVGLNGSDRHDVERMVAFQRSLGLTVEDLGRDELHAIEPNLAATMRYAAFVSGDHSVDNRSFIAALLGALTRLGVEMVDARVEGVITTDHGVEMVTTRGTLAARAGVVALGATSTKVAGLSELGVPSVRPVKGHVLRLGGDATMLRHTVRATVHGRSVYLVPRSSGEIVVGATVEERGFDQRIQVGEVFRLLEDARRVLPGIDELELVDVTCGLRPATSSNAPFVTAVEGTNLVIATGHYRNGVLLAPITASYVVSLLRGRDDADALLFEPLAVLR
jgi:glycine oxidase